MPEVTLTAWSMADAINCCMTLAICTKVNWCFPQWPGEFVVSQASVDVQVDVGKDAHQVIVHRAFACCQSESH